MAEIREPLVSGLGVVAGAPDPADTVDYDAIAEGPSMVADPHPGDWRGDDTAMPELQPEPGDDVWTKLQLARARHRGSSPIEMAHRPCHCGRSLTFWGRPDDIPDTADCLDTGIPHLDA